MIKGFKITLILVLFSNCLFSQVDSIKSQIMQYEDSKSTIISKGRKLLLDKFIDGDLTKVREIKNYLVKTEDDNYIALYPEEYWFVLYWTKDYLELAENIQNFDSAKVDSYYTKIRPLNDMLYIKLNEKSFENESQIKKQIQESDLDSETKQILILNFDYLLIENRKDPYTQDNINNQADKFLKTYPSSIYDDFTKTYHYHPTKLHTQSNIIVTY